MINIAFVICAPAASIKGHPVEGLSMAASSIRKALGVTYQVYGASDLLELDKLLKNGLDADLIMVKPSWGDTPEAISDVLSNARRANKGRSLGLLDDCDQTSSPHFSLLPMVDVFCKRQALKDHTQYQNDYLGGYVFTDYLVKCLGFDIGEWHFGSKPAPEHINKLVISWSFGVARRFRRMLTLSRFISRSWEKRPFDVNCRLGIAKRSAREWYERYRQLAGERLLEASRQCVRTGTDRVGRRQYIWEMLHSKIVFSPFGWGELCYRDFEAACCGALLIKPSMEHLSTSPDIFIPGETYVPVRWDLADLREKVEYYLHHPREAKQIAAAARGTMLRYFQEHQIVNQLQGIIEKAREQAY